jgi:hypothetical protein
VAFRCMAVCGLIRFSYRFEIAKLSISADMTKFLPSAFTILIKKDAGVQWIMNDE